MKNPLRQLCTLLVIICCTLTLFAQESPVKWTFKTVKINDSVAELQFKADIKKDWHLYAQSHNNGVELPLVFTFDKNSNYKRLGKVIEPKPTEENDELFGLSKYFTNSVTFKQRVQVLDNQPFTIKGKVEGQACIEGRCTQADSKFAFDIKGFDKVAKNNDLDNDQNENSDTLKGSTAAKTQITPAKDTPAEKNAEKEESLWKYFLGAVLGGLVGLLMPEN